MPPANHLQYYLDQYRTLQTTYHVQLTAYPDSGYSWRMYLLWDYDRLWGVSDFGYTKGVFLIDPGPQLPTSDEAAPQTLPFTWRGMRKAEPEISLCNSIYTKGEITIDILSGSLKGWFGLLRGNGDVGDPKGRCEFRANMHFGPAVVPHSLNEIVDDWNDYFPLVPEENIRQDLPDDALEEYRHKRGRGACWEDAEWVERVEQGA
ncbi:uncharacterized protein BDV17DRAFT_293951 [Aspergillus undulatus]|uniref:uncharacterized protein n=1 Tax=Aspergillus undulatus TaxID=1810928 RepID=UPI003CCD484C